MKRVPLLILLFAMCLAFSPPASASLTLISNNSSASIDPDSSSGMYDWIVDGTDYMYQQWFWYRIGGAGIAHPLNELGPATVESTKPNQVTLTYTSTTLPLTVQIDYILRGGPVGSLTADIGETISATYTAATGSLDFHFFQYSDFDLNGPLHPGDDTVSISTDKGRVTQMSTIGGGVLSETPVVPTASHAEANVYNLTLQKFAAGFTTLNDNLAAAGDVTWAFEWDKTLTPTKSLLISKNKLLSPTVPEPAAIALLGGVLVAFASKLRKRSA